MANHIPHTVAQYLSPFLNQVSAPLVLGAASLLILWILKVFLQSCRSGPRNLRPFDRSKLADLILPPSGLVTKESETPRGWWTSKEALDLERRAIFSKKPVALAHISMFNGPGSYHTVGHPAGYPLFLILGRDGVLRGFHNVCRHRAYPVVSTKAAGCAFVLGCKYHGWSYDLRGNLIKAPKFDHLQNFNKQANSLHQVKVMVADDGTVLVDVGTAPEEPERSFQTRVGMSPQAMWDIEGAFNWKLTETADAFSLPTLPDSVETQSTGIRSLYRKFARALPPRHSRPSLLADIINAPEHDIIIMLLILPISAEKTQVKVSLYSCSSVPAASTLVDSIKHDLSQAVLRLERAHSRIRATCETSNEVHHMILLDWIEAHRRLERLSGRPIWPASEMISQSSIDASTEAERLYQELEVADAKCGDQIHKGSVADIDW